MDNLDFVDKAFDELCHTLASGKKDMLENINRANKGELFALHFLTQQDVKVLPTELSTALQVTTGRVSALLASLEKKGYIHRETDKNNRRNIHVTITDAGRRYFEEETKSIKQIYSNVFIEMGKDDTLLFLNSIKQFYELSQKYMHSEQ
ncbi:MAG: transcriptional regulator [Oscillospiraceae bacterium]|nr:transcriptional regulator [Oscillospiraceae bacterium]